MKRKQLSNAKHLNQWPSTMETYVFPVLRQHPDRRRHDSHVIEVLDPIWYDKPETAKRVLQRIEAVFKSAILRGSREKASPCVGVVQEFRMRHREVQHHAALPWQEVPAFVAMLQRPAQRGWPTTRLAFEFLILTATRSSETREAVWSEFDLEKAIWVISQGADEVAESPQRAAQRALPGYTPRSSSTQPRCVCSSSRVQREAGRFRT